MLAAIEWAPIGESVLAALAAGLGVVLAFAVGMRGLIRAHELREDGRVVAAGAWAVLGATGMLMAFGGTLAGLLTVAST
jgi:hypothetical protein